MRTLTKEEILDKAEMFIIKNDKSAYIINDGSLKQGAQLLADFAEEFSDQETARLTAINEKQAELIEAYQTLQRYTSMDESLNLSDEKLYDRLREKLTQLESKITSLQSVKEADNCIHFDSCQGRNHCLTDVKGNRCIGVDCGHFVSKVDQS